MRHSRTSCANSAGSMEKALSTPPGADAERVVGEADAAAEELAQVRERAEVRAGGARGVARRALEERHVGATVFARGADEFVELGDARHARGGDERLFRLRDAPDERQVDVFERRDLVERRVERFEEVDGRRCAKISACHSHGV